MTDHGSTQPANTTAAKEQAAFRPSYQEWVVAVLIVLSIIGVGVTDFAPAVSHWYWLAMVPLFGGACLLIEWDRAKGKGLPPGVIIRNQGFVWISLLVAVQLVYLLLHAGRLDNENTGLIILLMLSLTVFGSGIYLGWRLCVVGILLGVALVLATYLEEFIWLFMLFAIAGAAAVFFVYKYRSTKVG